MKKTLSILSALCVSTFAFAQTNTFPTSGNVGIGTTSPSYKAEIYSGAFGLSGGSETFLEFHSLYSTADYKKWRMAIGGGLSAFNLTTRYDNGALKGNILTITNSGNVGFGTTTPDSKLHLVNGVNNSTTLNLDGNLIEVSGGSVSKYQDISFTASGTAGNAAIRHYANAWQNSRSELAFLVNDNTGLYEALRINNEGRIGIGTPSPNDLLHISKASAHTRLRVGNNAAYDQLIYFNGFADWSIGIDQSNSNAFSIASTSSLDNSHRFVINGGGNVGIGTTSPTEKLEVNGTIRSKKVKVEATGWPDYVFSGNYKLRTLNELEQYIQANKHLPEVPSAKEIEVKGQDLGDIQVTLLKKVEELTLYMIQLNKTVQTQDERIKELERENEILKSQKK